MQYLHVTSLGTVLWPDERSFFWQSEVENESLDVEGSTEGHPSDSNMANLKKNLRFLRSPLIEMRKFGFEGSGAALPDPFRSNLLTRLQEVSV